MVNRRRSTGFFLGSLIVVMLMACSGKSSSEYDYADEQAEKVTLDNSSLKTDDSNPPIKIMLLGDSITQGDSNHRSYRYFLWQKLLDVQANVDLIGSMRENYNGSPEWPDYRGVEFDRDHEGHWGWRIDELLEKIDGWLKKNQPDVVLLHIGSNDVFHKNSLDSTIDELIELIGRLRAANDQVALFIAKVLPADRLNSELTELNKNIVETVNRLNNERSPIFIVDQNTGFNVTEDTYDGVHPNASGEMKMADIWMKALMRSEILLRN